MKHLYENSEWIVYQSDINVDVVVICQKNNQLGSLNFSVEKKQLESLWAAVQIIDFKERLGYDHPVYASNK
jgi:hypothetical protein